MSPCALSSSIYNVGSCQDGNPYRIKFINKAAHYFSWYVVSHIKPSKFWVFGRQTGGSLKKMEHTDLLEPTEKGTKLTSIMEYELPYSLLGRIIDKLRVKKIMEKAGEYQAQKTKELLEKT